VPPGASITISARRSTVPWRRQTDAATCCAAVRDAQG
jgi:hypothetical protein